MTSENFLKFTQVQKTLRTDKTIVSGLGFVQKYIHNKTNACVVLLVE